jgi:hypothetical protein
MNVELSRQIFEKEILKYIKILFVRLEYFHAEGQTDGQTEGELFVILIKRPKKCKIYRLCFHLK